MYTSSPLSKYISAIFILITTLVAFVPFSPIYPNTGLDNSWVFAMNQAVAQGLIFGKEIIFTFGPYASIYTQAYHPSTDSLMLFGSFFLGLNYALLLIFLIRGKNFYWLVLYGIFIVCLLNSRDALLLSYPFLLALLTYRGSLPSGHINHITAPRYIALFFAPLGLLPLIKGSMIIPAFVIPLLCFVLYTYRRLMFLAWASLLVPPVFFIIFWTIAGQPLNAIPDFFLNTVEIIAGYTEAMKTEGYLHEIIFYFLTSLCVLYALTTNVLGPKIYRIFLLFSYGLFLFVAFKGGFVRHDGHALLSSAALGIAAFTLAIILKTNSRLLRIIFILTFITWISTFTHYIKLKFPNINIPVRLFQTYSQASQGLFLRINNPNQLTKNFNAHIHTIKNSLLIPKLQGTVDIYSAQQSYLIASGNTWNPRPVLQSYSAYTPKLLQIDAAHLSSQNAADNILFRIEPIDGRFPALEDGASWPAILYYYSPVKLENDYAYLRKITPTPEKQNSEKEKKYFYAKKHKLHEEIRLPPHTTPLMAEIEISPTIPGKIVSLLFKPTQLKIQVTLTNGKTKSYRFVTNMAKSGFLISPLIENTQDFFHLFNHYSNKEVKSFKIIDNKMTFFWQEIYLLRLYRVPIHVTEH